MSIAKTRRNLYRAQRLLGDVQAIRTGRIRQRLTNRILGRMIGRATRRLWR